MVINKHSHIVGVGDGTMGDVWASSLAMHVNAGATERGVCEVAVVDKWLTLFRNSQTIFSHVGGVVWGIKLKRGREEREGGKEKERGKEGKERGKEREGGKGGKEKERGKEGKERGKEREGEGRREGRRGKKREGGGKRERGKEREREGRKKREGG